MLKPEECEICHEMVSRGCKRYNGLWFHPECIKSIGLPENKAVHRKWCSECDKMYFSVDLHSAYCPQCIEMQGAVKKHPTTIELTTEYYNTLIRVAASAFCFINVPSKESAESLKYWVKKWDSI